MLLVFTGSGDGTSDLLFQRLSTKAFRFNFDIFREYSVTLTSSHWSIRNPHGFEISSDTATVGFWWKAFNYFTDQEEFLDTEVKYVFRELYSWFKANGAVKGNSPDFHKERGKIFILGVAKSFFPVPETIVGWGFKDLPATSQGKRYVAKSLASGLTTTSKALFTTEVDLRKLDPSFPWYLQEAIDAEADVTIFICGRKKFTFSRSRAGLVGLDWRNQGFRDKYAEEWQSRELSSLEKAAVDGFCLALGVEWGRLDFLEVQGGLIFLEFNANGQWVFLDQLDKVGLVGEVVDYLLSPS